MRRASLQVDLRLARPWLVGRLPRRAPKDLSPPHGSGDIPVRSRTRPCSRRPLARLIEILRGLDSRRLHSSCISPPLGGCACGVFPGSGRRLAEQRRAVRRGESGCSAVSSSRHVDESGIRSQLRFAETIRPRLRVSADSATLAEVESRYGALMEALEWLLDAGRTDDALRLASTLVPFWIATKRIDDGDQWFPVVWIARTRRPEGVRARCSTTDISSSGLAGTTSPTSASPRHAHGPTSSPTVTSSAGSGGLRPCCSERGAGRSRAAAATRGRAHGGHA